MLLSVVVCGIMGSSSRDHGIKMPGRTGSVSSSVSAVSPGSSVASHCKMCQRVTHAHRAVEDSRGAWAHCRRQKLAGNCSHPTMRWADSAAGWGWGRSSTLHPLLHQDGDSCDKNTFLLIKVKKLPRSLGFHQIRSSVPLSVRSCACAGHGAPSRDSQGGPSLDEEWVPKRESSPSAQPQLLFHAPPGRSGAEHSDCQPGAGKGQAEPSSRAAQGQDGSSAG